MGIIYKFLKFKKKLNFLNKIDVFNFRKYDFAIEPYFNINQRVFLYKIRKDQLKNKLVNIVKNNN